MAHTIKHYSNILIDEKETARYLGFGTKMPDAQTQKLILRAKDELVSDCRVCAMETPVCVSEDGKITFDGFSVTSKSLAKNLLGCEKAVVFGATIGAGCCKKPKSSRPRMQWCCRRSVRRQLKAFATRFAKNWEKRSRGSAPGTATCL